MSAPSIPPDQSFNVEQLRQASAENARNVAKADADQRRNDLTALRSGAGATGRSSAEHYFTDQGLDPGQYSNSIDNKINEIIGSISPDDPNPGSYFKNVGQDVYNQEEAGLRNKLGRQVDELFPTNFDRTKIADTADDPYLAGILGEQRTGADQIIENMLKRGVITDTGKNAAEQDLERQSFGARSKLNEIGAGTLATGRQGLTDIANRGRQGAATAHLGGSFDPYSYVSDADKSFNDFVSSLGDTLRGKVPGNLFNTGSLAAVAGAGQGAQNTKFNPAALAGIITDTKNQNPDPLLDPNSKDQNTIF